MKNKKLIILIFILISLLFLNILGCPPPKVEVGELATCTSLEKDGTPKDINKIFLPGTTEIYATIGVKNVTSDNVFNFKWYSIPDNIMILEHSITPQENIVSGYIYDKLFT